ncbi:MAG: hypothetical protein ACJ74O_16865 [Frankiaceae bacterium]
MSIKTYSFQDHDNRRDRLGRWTKNIVRNDHELRGEARVLHQRQPYSVLVALMFEPWTTCDDGNPSRASDVHKSSFAHHVSTLAKRTGRGKRAIYGGGGGWVDLGADDTRYDFFERALIGLHEQSGPERGSVRFFDVEKAPPRNGRRGRGLARTCSPSGSSPGRRSPRQEESTAPAPPQRPLRRSSWR